MADRLNIIHADALAANAARASAGVILTLAPDHIHTALRMLNI